MYCIVGLGNPGQEYEATRHNVGFRVVDRLAANHGSHVRRSEFGALTATVRIGRTEVLVMKPLTYMNRSGAAVAAALADKGLGVDRLVVAYDDVDLPLARVRVRAAGGAGGHRGVASIIDTLGSEHFVRVRLGVGRPALGIDMIEHVLAPFGADEISGVDELIERGAAATATVVEQGVVAAMQTYNGLPPASPE